MSCDHDCAQPPAFPRVLSNRPGLPRIDYRIGTYSELRERMLALLDRNPTLAAWTHRGVDDPGIALVESAAAVGDILTLYQELYANELYLRTAQSRESVAELVRLLGYRLAPGVAGEATFALAVKGGAPVTVPQGFGLKAQIEGLAKPGEFESTAELVAYPHLSQFHLYRPRTVPSIGNGTQSFFMSVGPAEGLSFKSGDRILVGTTASATPDPTRLGSGQILIVDRSWTSFGALYVKFTTGLVLDGAANELQAYKLGDSYRHFGHNAPPIYFDISGSTTIPKSTSYLRYDEQGGESSKFSSMKFSTELSDLPLDSQVSDLASGDRIIVQGPITVFSSNSVERVDASYSRHARHRPEQFTLVSQVVSLTNSTLTFGSVSGPSTVLTLAGTLQTLMRETSATAVRADIRSMTLHQVVGAPFRLRAEHVSAAAPKGNELYLFGTDADLESLRRRRLLLAGPAADDAQFATVTDLQGPGLKDGRTTELRRVTLDADVSYANFNYDESKVTVYGNLVPATQGHTEKEVPIGSGDRRQMWQTFGLPKSPLTYLLDETRTPAQAPRLHVYVNGIEWTVVDTFFNSGPEDTVYVVREDDSGRSYVQFGDGKTGRRLPSGLDNVTAVFRVGIAAYGHLKAGTNPQITGKLLNFEKLYLPLPVSVGASREDADGARAAAPGKVQSLGRMVSLTDIEAEALALPHVQKASARWIAPEGIPLVQLTVLTESGEATDLAAVRDSMRTFNRCRGPARYPIDVVRGIRQYVYLKVDAGFDPSRREADVAAGIKRSLGLTGEEGNGIDGAGGLFELHMRRFGESVHRSQVVAAIQNTEGVTWARLKSAQVIDLGTPAATNPLVLAAPSIDIVSVTLDCPDDRALALYTAHLSLSLSKDDVARECAL